MLKGIFWSYVVFNILAVYLLSWFYLHGFQALKRKLSWRKLQKVR